MKERILLFIVTLIGVTAFAQTGINTTSPKATLHVEAKEGEAVDGILIPRVNTTRRNAFVNPENGLMIYNTDLKCHEINVGSPSTPEWQCVATTEQLKVVEITPVGFIGNFRSGTFNDPNVHKIQFEVTNLTGATLNNLDLSYIYVTSEQEVVGNQNSDVTILPKETVLLTYDISGGNTGKSTFTLCYDKNTCASIELNPDKINSGVGSGEGDDGTADFYDLEKDEFLVQDNSASIPIDKKVTISSTNPYFVDLKFNNGFGNYLEYTSPIVEMTDINGNIRQVQLYFPEGNLDIGKGSIKAEITSVDGNDIILPQTQLGGRDLIFQIPIKLNGVDKGSFDLYAFGGIPDRRYGDGSGHDFIYMPIVSPSGKTWLNNNLGAEYANIESGNFDPNQQAVSYQDPYAIGSLFQNKRYADGHELTSVDNGTFVSNVSRATQGTVTTFRPDTDVVYRNPERYNSDPDIRSSEWVDDSYRLNNLTTWNTLWYVDGENNPCPNSFRPAKGIEIDDEIKLFDELSEIGAFEYPLKFTQFSRMNTRLTTSAALFTTASNARQKVVRVDDVYPVRCIKHE